MKKIRIVTLESERGKLLNLLQSRSAVQLIKEETLEADVPQSAEETTTLLARIEFAIKFLSERAGKNGAAKIETQFVPDEMIETMGSDKELLERIAKVENCAERQNISEQELKEVEGELNRLAGWEKLELPPRAYLHGTEHFAGFLGTLESADENFWKTVREKLTRAGAHVEEISRGEKTRRALLVYKRDDAAKIEKIAAEAKFADFSENNLEETVAARISTLQERKKNLMRALESIGKAIAEQVGTIGIFHMLYDYHVWRRDFIAASEKTGRTRFMGTVVGWAPEKDLKALSATLKKELEAVEIFEAARKEGEEPPILLKNYKLLAPFETVTTLYGLPRPHEGDPTPYLAAFFIAFFGLCLTDAGYGITLALATGLALVFGKKYLDPGMRRLVKLLFYGGIVTFLISVPFGGWFGMDSSQAPDFLLTTNGEGKEIFIFQMLNPLEDPNSFMYLALGLGAFQLWLGNFIGFAWKMKRKEYSDAISTHVPWALLLPVGGLKFLAYPDSTFLTISVYALLALVIIGAGRGQKWYLKVPAGLYGTINRLIGFMGNTLSYLRLLALGLATGVVGLAINQIAIVFGELIPVVGPIAMVLILIIGHLANLLINGLGAFIHSSRLQFVEFFSEFFEGGGTGFRPLRRERIYTKPL